MSQLGDIKARAEKATEGPWSLAHPRPDGRNLVERRGYDLYGGEVSEMIIVDTNPSDAEFIAHARADVPKLVAALEAVQKMAADVPRVVAFGGTKHSGILIADDILKTIDEALS